MSLYDKASLIMTPSGVKSAKIYSKKPFNANGDFTFDRNSTVATRVNKDGLIETVAIDIPRLNYPFVNGVVQDDPSLLLEPAITNQLNYSEDFTQPDWSKSNVNTPVLQTSVIAPDGTTNVYLLTNSSSSNPLLYDNYIGSSTNDSTFSIFVKYYNLRYLSLRIDTPTKRVLFDIENGTVVSVDSGVNGTIKNYGNGWYKCSITHTALTTSNNAVIELNDTGLLSNFYILTTGSGYYLFGAQYEVNSYPTSYIPTSGSAVTRAAETASGAGTLADFNSSEGVLFAEISALADDGTSRRISLSNGSTSQRVSLEVEENANDIQAIIVSGTSQVGMVVSLANVMLFNKIAFKYKENNFAIWANGFELDTDTNGITPTSLSELAFDDGNGGADFYGNTKELAVFKTALTDTELESLTSWTSFNAMATGQLYTIK